MNIKSSLKELPILQPCTASLIRLRLCKETEHSHRWHIGLSGLRAMHTTGQIQCIQNITARLCALHKQFRSARQRNHTFNRENSPCAFLTVRVRVPTLPTCFPKLRGLPSGFLVQTTVTAKRAMKHRKCKQMASSTKACMAYMFCSGMLLCCYHHENVQTPQNNL